MKREGVNPDISIVKLYVFLKMSPTSDAVLTNEIRAKSYKERKLT